MKVAVYTIALNEEQFVETWYNSVKDEADYLLIVDTGSTDKTVEKARALGINVAEISVKPWRFDTARNASLALVPTDMDYCVPLDMDEIMLPGWRAELQKAFDADATRPRYKYVWNWNEDGTPGLTFGGDKIHKRHGYRWKNPVHEVLVPDRMQNVEFWTDAVMEHHADNTKSRAQYLPLLKASVDEDPYDDRNTFYYARELYFYNHYEESVVYFKKHLALPNARWAPERAASMRYIGKIVREEAELWFTLAAKEAPGRREPHVDLAKYYYGISDWDNCYKQSIKALEIAEKPLEYLCEAEAWGYTPFDMASISAYNLGKYEEAKEYAIKALEISPPDQIERLKSNLQFCEEKLK
jgi:glycosyltransferase involved in cell wall biosynthesis